MTGEKGDADYFHFTSKEAQFVKFDVSGIPGVDISAGVYEKDQLFPPVGDGEEEQCLQPMYHQRRRTTTNLDEMPPLYVKQ